MNEFKGIPRRELLQRAAILLGGTLSAPAVLGVLNGCGAHAATAQPPAFFDNAQLEVIGEVAEIIIPRTDTPGARDVGVPTFIDTMLGAVYPQADQQRYLAGLAEFEALAAQRHGRAFLQLPAGARAQLVADVHDAALRAESGRNQRPFILMTKELTLLGFFTSEPGATEVLQYEAVPGTYDGCLRLKKAGNGRTWATEKNLPF